MLILNLLKFYNGIIHLQYLERSIIILGISSIQPGQTERMCSLAWLYTGGKGLSLLFVSICNVKFTPHKTIPCCLNDQINF